MGITLQCEVNRSWPRLAWCARVQAGDPIITCRAGTDVEACDEALCEATWDGAFAEAGFDLTDIVSGTGIRIREGSAVFVSSGSTVDRLAVMRTEREILVSNSLSCLLSESASRPVVIYPYYQRDFESIINGLDGYRHRIPTTRFPVELVYFDNLHWNSHELVRMKKPNAERRFACFDDYHDFVRRCLEGVAGNAADPARRTAFSLLSTLSSGYDSSTISTLACEAGCRTAISCVSGRDGHDDSGAAVAASLGLQVHAVAREAHTEHPRDEVIFHAGDGEGSESFLGGAGELLQNRVLLTGFYGDKMWAKDTKALGSDIVRGDASGLSITEFRLRRGFLHCPVPFWGVRSIRDVVGISNSAEMKPWDVDRPYSRPICRRIVESAGVPREGFGLRKNASAKTIYEARSFLIRGNFERYRAWLAKHRWKWLLRGRIPPGRLTDRLFFAVQERRARAATWLMRFVGGKPILWRYQKQIRDVRDRWEEGRMPLSGLRRYCTQWAVEESMSDFLPVYGDHAERGGSLGDGTPPGDGVASRGTGAAAA